MTGKAASVPTAAAAEGSAPNLHKDEVTGEMVSKSELKKRQKKREADAKKVCFSISRGSNKKYGRGGGFFFLTVRGDGWIG